MDTLWKEGERIYGQIRALAGISEPCAAGTQRQSYSAAYRRGADFIRSCMEDLGMEIREDQAGNLFGTLRGTCPDLPAVLSGSHLDTVRCAGAFDGAAGVLCALSAARMVRGSGEPLRHSFTVVGTVGEEGTRFGKVLLGSQCMAGDFTEGMQDSLIGPEDGLTMRQALQAYGLSGDLSEAAWREPVLAFLELHGEQGPVLEETGTDLGIVETITGIERFSITIDGMSGHCGTVPMDRRSDAGIAAARIMVSVRDYCRRTWPDQATVTFGSLSLEPGSSNVIPGKCVFSADLRAGEAAVLKNVCRFLKEETVRICADEGGCRPKICSLGSTAPVRMDPHLRELLAESCAYLGYTCRRMNSGAGHDSMVFASRWPTAMLFLPNAGGISHHPDEEIRPAFLQKGTEVLYRTLRQLDRE